MASNEQLRLEAAKLGKVRFNGTKCRVCGSRERYVCSGGCCDCNKLRSGERQRKLNEELRRLRRSALDATRP